MLSFKITMKENHMPQLVLLSCPKHNENCNLYLDISCHKQQYFNAYICRNILQFRLLGRDFLF